MRWMILSMFIVLVPIAAVATDPTPIVVEEPRSDGTTAAKIQLQFQPIVTPPVSGSFDPLTLTGGGETVFKFTVKPEPDAQPDARSLIVTPPDGFKVSRQRFDYSGIKGLHGEVIVERTRDDAQGRIMRVNILARGARGATPISTTYFAFTYVPLVDIGTYFGLGLAGIALGYFVRFAKKLLDSTEPPPHRLALIEAEAADAAAAGDTSAPTPTTPQRLFWKYWYWVDFAVTVVVGLVLLITMMQSGMPPSTASFPMNVLAIGFGVGLLTNTELLTRVAPR